ncbi:integrase core domain-containing protein, partial [Kocuria carniphila]
AMAETVNALHKAELIYARPAWPSVTEVEFATMNWVHWWNHDHIHDSLNYRTPVEIENAYHQTHESSPALA